MWNSNNDTYIIVNLYQYISKEYFEFSEKILYFLNNKDCIIFGGFVKTIIINEEWNQELDILCYDFNKTYNEFIKLYPPDSVENSNGHTILIYGNYEIDLCRMFAINDFTLNCLGLIGENIVVVPNIFTTDILYLINSFNEKTAYVSYISEINPNHESRLIRFKDWKIRKMRR